VTVRLANGQDTEKLIQVRFDYFAEEGWETTPTQKSAMRAQLQEYYSKHLNQDFFAALVEDEQGTVLSAAFLVIFDKPANLSWPTGKTGLMLNVLTYPQHRKKGYATSALNCLIDVAKKQNVSFIELSSSEMGKSVYKKLGFEEKEASHFIPMKLNLL